MQRRAAVAVGDGLGDDLSECAELVGALLARERLRVSDHHGFCHAVLREDSGPTIWVGVVDQLT